MWCHAHCNTYDGPTGTADANQSTTDSNHRPGSADTHARSTYSYQAPYCGPANGNTRANKRRHLQAADHR